MRINQNVAALNAWRNLTITDGSMGKALERLSSGMRINKAADDAAGLAISEKMRSQVRGLNQAVRNAQDAISLIQTAEGALQETQAILQRMRELAVQAASDTATFDDRLKVQKEVDALSAEITRISNTSEFNTKNLLAGGFQGQKFFIGANAGQDITVGVNAMDAFTLGVTASKGVTLLDGNGLSGPALTGSVATGTYTVSSENAADDIVAGAVSGNGVASISTAAGLSEGVTYRAVVESDIQVSNDGGGVLLTAAAGSNAGAPPGVYSAQLFNLATYNGGLEDLTGAQVLGANGLVSVTNGTRGGLYTLTFKDDATDYLRLDYGAESVTVAYNNGAAQNYTFALAGGHQVVVHVLAGLNGNDGFDDTFQFDTYAKFSTLSATTAASYVIANTGTATDVDVNVGGDEATLTFDTALYSANVGGSTGLGNRTAFATADVQVFNRAYLTADGFLVGSKVDIAAGGVYTLGDSGAGSTVIAQMGTSAQVPGLGDAIEYREFTITKGAVTYTLADENGTSVATATSASSATSVNFSSIGLTFDKDPLILSNLAATVDIVSASSTAAETNASGGIQTKATVGKGILINTQANASGAITVLDEALKTVSTQRASLGAIQNRLEHTIANLTVASENLTASESRIRDVDMASEMANFTRAQILLQAGTAMMAQANARPQAVLQLLR
jgi:flagellin